MRIISACRSCGQPSILKMKGIFKARIELEAAVPCVLLGASLPEEWTKCKYCHRPASQVELLKHMFLTNIKEASEFVDKYGTTCVQCSGLQTELAREMRVSKNDIYVATTKAFRSFALHPVEAANRELHWKLDETP